jgi:hypothetical protein
MEFRLIYQGSLKSNGNAKEKHAIREALHSQLIALWDQEPLLGYKEYLPNGASADQSPFVHDVGKDRFVTLVSSKAHMLAELHVTFLRPESPGTLMSNAGDIDNRIKTLFDGLRKPNVQDEIPSAEVGKFACQPMFCLLEDDSLISTLTVETDRLLGRSVGEHDVVLVMRLKIKVTRPTIAFFALGL